ncbi:sporulation protein YqfC [Caldanaerobius fijiensis DSM 17918]|uniref:Sporulation protein YqfC n=1 Tax=Caldanaerobius fijiensis DSM 17918 TaxID=1121256 RepID=A0A1M4SE65_9THEO|nr:sporulation protein YqfC [Caldanaerobius fijiensis]SHE30500.1 sporulation protein YqfC [Caldanaerobius fijiensis DSM 17918]
MKEDLNRVKKAFADMLDYPKDVILDMPRITMIGDIELVIDNHKGIIEYKSDIIRLNSGCGVVRITGKNLTIKEIQPEEIYITGNITAIDFMQ